MALFLGQTGMRAEMFYQPRDGHGLPHNPFTAIVTPRPIGWISTRGSTGDNLAPYSFFNAVAYDPPQVMFASTAAKRDRGDTKDSVANIRESGVFAVNIVAFDQRDQMNASSGPWPAETDEFDLAGTPKAECVTIPCPRVARSPATLECRLAEIVTLRGRSNFLVIGEVTGVHLRDDCLSDGLFDVTRFQPLARSGYRNYAVVREVFAMRRPDEAD
jgi:flavin reductase (DIM6/NTAB) family NADH-FMN oxidoreductase RutF